MALHPTSVYLAALYKFLEKTEIPTYCWVSIKPCKTRQQTVKLRIAQNSIDWLPITDAFLIAPDYATIRVDYFNHEILTRYPRGMEDFTDFIFVVLRL